MEAVERSDSIAFGVPDGFKDKGIRASVVGRSVCLLVECKSFLDRTLAPSELCLDAGLEVLVGEAVAETAVAAFAALEVGDGFEQMHPAEVGPEAVGDKDLGVGDLPEQEVRDALLAAGADDQIGIGHACGVEPLAYVTLLEAL